MTMASKFLGSGLLAFVLIAFTATEAKFYSVPIARDRLLTDLFVNYDNAIKPGPKGKPMEIRVNIVLQHFNFRERDGAFQMIGILHVMWKDPKLEWNPNDYNNITKIPVNQRFIWVPDLEIYSNAPDKFLRMHRNGDVGLDYKGRLVWSDTIEVTVFCNMDMQNWPHDHHECKMSLGSWTYDGFELDILSSNPNGSLQFDEGARDSNVFKVVAFNATHETTTYPCCPEPYISIDYHIAFERYSNYVILFRVQALCVIFLSLLALLMEPRRSEKIWLTGISFIIVVSNLLYFGRKVGSFARCTPAIVSFYSGSLVLITMIHIISVFSLFATRSRFRGKLPERISVFLQSPMLKFIAPQTVKKVKLENTEFNSQFEDVKLQEFCSLISPNDFSIEWLSCAKVIQRIGLLLFSFIYLILGTICLV